jgi:signal transduction histidine kinase
MVAAKGTRNDFKPLADERIPMIAHDLKTPLSIILLETELLGESVDVTPAVQHSLERIAHNAAYIDRLVADLLDLTTENLQLHSERVDLAMLVRDTLERAVSTVDRDRVAVAVEPLFARCDPNRLERVLANFVSNALKYSQSMVTVTLAARGNRARVTVLDHGRGLTEAEIATLFHHATKSGAGHGLGLYISRKIIDALGGEIGVISTPGQGAEFFFELPTIP